ncbi:hypothetical protein AS156_16025 [Bradyrhizobium macuxiense]|uniref:Phosphotriesterase-related protein n=2 Tax=Bradyrhizobium macuxiense TaxID=1755647 RepID=A0A120FJR3_9BRAD|nr:hypothetical protein AS156_16025 [Bradyrhizobium macuxiense]
MHEHLFIAFHGASFDPLAKFDRPEFIKKAVQRLVELRTEYGVRSFVDPCPIELGRDVTMMKEISERSGMHIVCTTGFYHEERGLPIYWRARTANEIADFYISEIARGIGDTGVKAGAIKVATGAPTVTALEKKFLSAACIAQKVTGVPIITHTTKGCAGPEQQQLFEAGGVAAHHCLIGHCCINPDPSYHRRIVDADSYIGFDYIGTTPLQSDEVRADNLAKLVHDGFRSQIIMSQDRWCGWLGRFFRQFRPEEFANLEQLMSPTYTYMFTDFMPLLHSRGVDQSDIDSILEDNPRRFFAGEGIPEKATKQVRYAPAIPKN